MLHCIYNSSNLHELDAYSQSADINVMIINIQAFNTSMNEEKNVEGRSGNEYARIIYSERDEFRSRRPIDVISANRPILILDEPQKMGSAESATQRALKKNFKPLFSINYSATHKTRHNLLYVLDPLDAFNKRLVKKIEVKGLEIQNLSGTSRYVYLQDILLEKNQAPRVKMEIEVKRAGGIKREVREFREGDSLYVTSENLEEYRGLSLTKIDPWLSQVEFSNGEILQTGKVSKDIFEEDLRRIQIRETILSHFAKERDLFERGIKCLSLFFIDEVKKYRDYDEEGKEILCEYGRVFEEEYQAILNDHIELLPSAYQSYLQGITAQETHEGYFSRDSRGRLTNSSVRRGNQFSEDITAYNLIMKEKELLLDFKTPVRFIFSHSALREGWDNTNIFQICTLKNSDSSINKRQEVGRGLRLCVDQSLRRQDLQVLGEPGVHAINTLTVIASESYASFVSELQKDIKQDLYDRPTSVSSDYFTNQTILANGKQHTLSSLESRYIYHYLAQHQYVDLNGQITETYRTALLNKALAPFEEQFTLLERGAHQLIQAIYDPSVLDSMITNAHATRVRENPIKSENWELFKEMWERIKTRYAYSVSFDSDGLIEQSVEALNTELKISKPSYRLERGEQIGAEFQHIDSDPLKDIKSQHTSSVPYDLIGKIAELTTLTRSTVGKILNGLNVDTLRQFTNNPEAFISSTAGIINQKKAAVIVENIQYAPSSEAPFTSEIFTTNKSPMEFAKAFKANKAIQDYVFTDGSSEESVERRFVKALERAGEVSVYAKLPSGPKGFFIPTPVGTYSPDWAISFKQESVKHMFFIAETKGRMLSSQFGSMIRTDQIELAKIQCAKKLFNELSSSEVKYHEVSDYDDMLRVIESL